ncbi:F-box and WD repeat domain containing protein 10B [Discoglossus pictus]
MEVSEFSLQRAPELRCENPTSMVTLCQTCETCTLATKVAITKEWFVRAGEASQRKFLFGIIRRLASVDLLIYTENVLQPTQGKDFIYSRSRINPSLEQDLSTSSSDRALNRNLLLKFMAETWDWFKNGSYWTKTNYTLLLLHMCSQHLLHDVANLIRVLIVRRMRSSSIKEGVSQQEKLGVWEQEGMKKSRIPKQVSPDDPSLMVVPTSFKSTSGVNRYKDFIRSLPVHLSKRILGFLDQKSLLRCALVSQHWRYLATDLQQDLHAERIVQNEAMILQGTSYKGVSVSYAKIQQIHVPRVGEDGNIVPACEKKYQELNPGERLESSYMDIETDQVSLEERNLFCGSYNVLILTGVTDPHRVIHFDGGRFVAVGSVDRKVKLLDMVEMKQVPPLIHGHAGSIRVVHLCEEMGFVFSGSFDLSIRQWDLQTGVCLRIFHGHMKTITCLDLHEDTLVSGSKDCLVKVWNITTGKCFRTFKHKNDVLSVKLNEKYVVSGCEKGLVKIWHTESGILIKTLTAHTGPVKCLSFDQWHLLSGSADGYAMVWSMMGNFQKPLMSLRHPREVLCLEFLYLRAITGCADGKIRVFNVLNGDCLRVMRANSRADPVMSLCIRGNRMVINTPTSVLIFQFEEVSWDYSQESERMDVQKERERYKSAPIRSQPYPYVRAQRMKRVGSSNRKIYQQDEEEYEEGKSRLSHHARSLSARSMKTAQDLHLESLKPATWPDLRNYRRSFAYIDLQPEFYKKPPSARRAQTPGQSSSRAHSRASSAPEMKTRDDSDDESGYGSPGLKSALSQSEEATLKRIKKRGPHTPMSPDQILLKVSTIQNSQQSSVLNSNLENNDRVRDTWGPPILFEDHKTMVTHFKTKVHPNGDYVKILQHIKSSDVPGEVKTQITPFVVKKLGLKLKESLHGPEIKSSIPSPTIVRPQTSWIYRQRKQNVALQRRSSSSAIEGSVKLIGHYTSCEMVQPLKMMMGQSNHVPRQKSTQSKPVVDLNPYREKCGFQLLTVRQLKEFEANKMAEYQAAEAHVLVGRDRESRKAWLMKIKGESIDGFTKHGKIAAPEFGPDVFV